MPFAEHQGIRLYFQDTGSGPPVILGHSFLCSGEMWKPQVERLAERFRIINVDLRGHGRSGPCRDAFSLYDLVSDLVAVLDEVGIERAVWAGLSIGGMVALRAAVRVPDRVSALILLDTDAGAELAYKKLKYRAMGFGARLFGIRPFLSPIARLMFGRSSRREHPQLVGEWRERFAGNDLSSTLATLDALMGRDSVLQQLDRIRVPSLVIVGEEDQSLPPACAARIAAGLQGSELMVIPAAGHLTTLEQPEAVLEAMLDFLEAQPK